MVIFVSLASTAYADGLADVKKAQDAARRYESGKVTDQKDAEKAMKAVDDCVKSVDAAIAGGASASDTVEVSGKVPGATKAKKGFVAPLGAVKAYCQDVGAAVRARGINQALKVHEGWIKKLESTNQPEAEYPVALRAAESCARVVAKAIADGVPPTTELTLKMGKIVLSDANVKVCDAVKAAGEKVKVAIAAKLEKKLAPFKAALKGDKLRLCLERDWAFGGLNGSGGAAIESPQDIAAAGVIYETLQDDDGLFYRWTTRAFRFKGDTLVGNPTEKSGLGRSPPSGAFP